MNGDNFKNFRPVVATYIGDRVEFAVKKHFADPPRHMDVRLVRQKHPNQEGHTRKLIQRQSASEREKREERLYLNEFLINKYDNPNTSPHIEPPRETLVSLIKVPLQNNKPSLFLRATYNNS